MALGLTGDLDVMPLADVALYLGNRRLNGKLTFWSGQSKRGVTLQAGVVVESHSNEPREFLTQFLINFGHLDEDRASKAFRAHQQSNGRPLGDVLVTDFNLPVRVVEELLTLKARETLLAGFRLGTGSFRFDLEPEPQPVPGISVKVPLLDVHREGEFRESAWQQIRTAFPSGDLLLQLDDARVRPATPGTMDARLYEAIRDGLTIDEMVFALRTVDFHLYQGLFALQQQGIVRALGPKRDISLAPPPSRSTSVLGEETPLQHLLDHARSFIAAGSFVEAELLCDRIAELGGPQAVAELRAQAEHGIHGALASRFLRPPRVPLLQVDPQQLRSTDLSPPERYLLARVDGVRDVPTIISVAPLREVEALKYFQRFVDTGLIALA